MIKNCSYIFKSYYIAVHFRSSEYCRTHSKTCCICFNKKIVKKFAEYTRPKLGTVPEYNALATTDILYLLNSNSLNRGTRYLCTYS